MIGYSIASSEKPSRIEQVLRARIASRKFFDKFDPFGVEEINPFSAGFATLHPRLFKFIPFGNVEEYLGDESRCPVRTFDARRTH